MRSLGIDVGEVKKGLDLVLLNSRKRLLESCSKVAVDDLPQLIEAWRPDVIAIDSPPKWRRGPQRRTTEQDLASRGITSYSTPQRSAWGHGFSAWMECGRQVFRKVAVCGFDLTVGPPVKHRAIEVFPHASAVTLAGSLPPRGANKCLWRAWVLQGQNVLVWGNVWSEDQIDATLAAFTGLRALQGKCSFPSSSTDGVIVVPTVTLAERYVSV